MLRSLWEAVERRRRPSLLAHDGRRRLKVVGAMVPDKGPADEDFAIAARLLAAHRSAVDSAAQLSQDKQPDVWTDIRARQSDFESILESGDVERLAAYLCNVSRHSATHGISQGDVEHARLSGSAARRRAVAQLTHDKLVSLAEATGALPVENPEQGATGANLRIPPAQLVDAIERHLGVDIAPPDVDGGMFRLQCGRVALSERDLSAICSAVLLRRAASTASARICEIGGGAGRMAYWSNRLGLTSYTVVDLPLVNVVQGYYLLKAIPGDRVLLYGEAGAADLFDGVRVLPTHAIADSTAHAYDVVFNQDSFPEMDEETVSGYLSWIKSCCDGQLISINQESKPPYGDGLVHVSVPEAVAASGGFELRQRFPYWLRKGYVVELYDVGA